MPRCMFLHCSALFSPKKTTASASTIAQGAAAAPEPTKLKKRCDTRMASEFYQMESADITCRRSLVHMVSDLDVWLAPNGKRSSFDDWVATQNSTMRTKARAFKDTVMDASAHRTRVTFCNKILQPIVTDLIRLGDSDSPKMGFVWKAWYDLGDKIDKVFDDEELKEDLLGLDRATLAEMITMRWQYCHSSYHSVGFLINPLFIDKDPFAKDAYAKEVQAELKADLKKVCQKLFYDPNDDDSAHQDMVEALLEYEKYRGDGAHRDDTSMEMIRQLKSGKMPLWNWWGYHSATFPKLTIVAERVLSKQVGIGPAERSHKQMKKHTFTVNRGSLDPKQANMECFVKYNAEEIDRRAPIPEFPEWLEEMSELDGVVLDSATRA